MEGKKQPASPPPPAPSSSSLVADLFGAKDAPKPSPSLFHSLFPPASTVMRRDSSRSEIFGPSGKNEAQNQTQDAKNVAAVGSTSVDVCPDDKSEGNAQRDKNPAYQQVKIDPCSLSSSLYYGGREIYINSASLHDFDDDYKTDGEDDSNNPNAASRGNWWQGSLYY